MSGVELNLREIAIKKIADFVSKTARARETENPGFLRKLLEELSKTQSPEQILFKQDRTDPVGVFLEKTVFPLVTLHNPPLDPKRALALIAEYLEEDIRSSNRKLIPVS